MTQHDAGLRAVVIIRLIKWAGEAQPTETPWTHPECLEIVDIDDAGNEKTVYRRLDS